MIGACPVACACVTGGGKVKGASGHKLLLLSPAILFSEVVHADGWWHQGAQSSNFGEMMDNYRLSSSFGIMAAITVAYLFLTW